MSEFLAEVLTETLIGSYKKVGNWLIKEDGNLVLLWRKRKKERDKKPEDFLLVQVPLGEKHKYKYLSSLYPKGEGSYMFDDRRRRYTLVVQGDKVYIFGVGRG